jgi:hypothetical protein
MDVLITSNRHKNYKGIIYIVCILHSRSISSAHKQAEC